MSKAKQSEARNCRKLLVGDLSLARFAKSFLFLYGFLMIYVYFVSDRMMFLPHDPSYDDRDGIIKIATQDGSQVSAMYLDNPHAEYTILYSHGNSEDIGDIRPLMEDYAAQGYSVVAYDYRGYGTSSGKPSERHAYLDIEAVYRYLAEQRKVSEKKIVAMGFSLGNGPTLYLAATHDLGAVVLHAPFLTVFRVVTRVPILPFDKFRNADRIRDITEPVLIVHGTADELIPFWHGQRLFDIANEPRQNLWVENAGHFDIVSTGGDGYWSVLNGFLGRLK